MLFRSRFSHVLEKGDTVAVFHSLKMKPVYLQRIVWDNICTILNSITTNQTNTTTTIDNIESLSIIDALKKNSTLIRKTAIDDQVLEHIISNIPPPTIKIAYFILAETCNMKCSYCFENLNNNIPKSKNALMSKTTVLKSLDFLAHQIESDKNGSDEINIIIYGGEPLLNWSALTLLLESLESRRKLNPNVWKRVKVSLVTNGTLISNDIACYLKKHNVSVGISIDGPKPVNDINRLYVNNVSSFDATMKGINKCRNASLDFGLSVTLSEECINSFREVIDFIFKIKPLSIGFNILMTNNSADYSNEYNTRAANFLIDAFQEFRKHGLYEDRIMRKVKSFIESRIYPFDCGATGGNQVVFAPSGRVGICHGFLQEKKFFPTTVDNHGFDPKEDPVFIEWGNRTPLKMTECQSCIALGICGGGCPLNAERMSGSIWNLDDRFCVHAKRTVEWLIWDLYEHMVESKTHL